MCLGVGAVPAVLGDTGVLIAFIYWRCDVKAPTPAEVNGARECCSLGHGVLRQF